VGKLSVRNPTSECIKELTLGRNHTNAVSAEKLSVRNQALENTRKLTRETNAWI
jgi:hypothetical protein